MKKRIVSKALACFMALILSVAVLYTPVNSYADSTDDDAAINIIVESDDQEESIDFSDEGEQDAVADDEQPQVANDEQPTVQDDPIVQQSPEQELETLLTAYFRGEMGREHLIERLLFMLHIEGMNQDYLIGRLFTAHDMGAITEDDLIAIASRLGVAVNISQPDDDFIADHEHDDDGDHFIDDDFDWDEWAIQQALILQEYERILEAYSNNEISRNDFISLLEGLGFHVEVEGGMDQDDDDYFLQRQLAEQEYDRLFVAYLEGEITRDEFIDFALKLGFIVTFSGNEMEVNFVRNNCLHERKTSTIGPTTIQTDRNGCRVSVATVEIFCHDCQKKVDTLESRVPIDHEWRFTGEVHVQAQEM